MNSGRWLCYFLFRSCCWVCSRSFNYLLHLQLWFSILSEMTKGRKCICSPLAQWWNLLFKTSYANISVINTNSALWDRIVLWGSGVFNYESPAVFQPSPIFQEVKEWCIPNQELCGLFFFFPLLFRRWISTLAQLLSRCEPSLSGELHSMNH